MGYTPKTWEDGVSGLDADSLNNIEAGIVALDTDAGASVSKPTRAFDTVYQNTSGQTIMVTITVMVDNGEAATLYYGATSSPATQIGKVQNSTGDSYFMGVITAPIIPDYYYTLVKTGDPGLENWIEGLLH